VGEQQATRYFTNGCREDTMMKHKLNRFEPKINTEFMAIPDKYSTTDSTMRMLVPVSDPAKKPPLLPFGPLWQYNRDRHEKRKDE
jgi:hypothetical protein